MEDPEKSTCLEGGGDKVKPPSMVMDKLADVECPELRLENVNKEPTANDIESLQNKLMELIRDDKPDAATKTDLTSKLEEGRVQFATEKRLARKAAWIAESQKEISQRQQPWETHLLKVFPELAWTRILKQLEENKDKIVMSNMDLLWRDLLKDERTTFLFNKVFPEVHDHAALSRDEILSCRCICKEWKNSLEVHLKNKIFPSTSLRNTDNLSDKLEMSFINDLALTTFLRKTKPSNNGIPWSRASPFISRKLRFGLEFGVLPPQYSQLVYWQIMQRILQYYGKHLWQANVTFDGNFLSINTHYRISEILKVMPNLRALTISGRHFISVAEADILESVELFKRNFQEPLQELIVQYPLPELPYIKNFEAEMIPFPIIKGILEKYGSTLEEIEISGPHGNLNNYFGNAEFPHCKRFFYSCSGLTLTEPRFSGSWDALEEIDLKMANVEGAITIPRIFQALSGFSATLRRLTLFIMVSEGPVVKLNEITLKMLSLELPNVEKFTLEVYRINLKTVDFILPMKSLKLLSIIYKKQGKRKEKPQPPIKQDSLIETDEIIKFGNYTNRMYDSNIWNLFPELVKVTITIKNIKNIMEDAYSTKEKAYTRDGYKHRDS